MNDKNIVIKILAVVVLPFCILWYFAFNKRFDGCPVPFGVTKVCEQEERNKRRKNN